MSKCQASSAKRWLEARQTQLLPVDYYHVIFTTPAAISQLAFYNKADIYGLLMQAAARTLTTVEACKKGFFLHERVLSRLFRRLFVEGLRELYEHKRLLFFSEVSELENAGNFAKWCTQQQNREWIVYDKKPFAGLKTVLAYLARYSHHK